MNLKRVRQQSRFFILGILFVGVALRMPFTAIPAIFTEIAQDLGVSVSTLGSLTTIPLIMFALFSSFAPKIAQKIGLERLFTFVLIGMILGSGVRVFQLPGLFIGTMVIGIGITMLNVLLPSVIVTNAPNKIGFYTTLYTSSMGLGTALFSAVAVPITQGTSWQLFVMVLTIILILILLVWFPNAKTNHYLPTIDSKTESVRLWQVPAAWILLIFSGVQSFLFYTGMTWLPTMAIAVGVKQTTAGTLSGFYTLIGLPFSMVLPIILEKLQRKQRQWLMGIFSLSGFLGVLLLLFPQKTLGYWLLVNCLIGIAVGAMFPYLMTTLSLKTTTPQRTAQLSGMVQTGGYLLAAVGPILFGYSEQIFHSWTPGVVLLLLVTLLMGISLFWIETYEKII